MRKHALMLLFATTAAIAPTVVAQPPAATTKPEANPARIEGRVLIKDSTTPIPRAQVKFAGKTAESADDGSFVLEDVAPGAALGTIMATKANFLDGGASPEATSISLAPGATLKDAVVYLLPEGVISGRITDSNRDPVARVQALVLQRDFLQGWPERRWLIKGSVNADDTGTFRIAKLRPGRYVLLAFRRQAREFPTGTAPEMDDVATFYPNSATLGAAVPIEVRTGEEVQGIQIQMRRERVYSISGKLAMENISPRALIAVVPEDIELPMGFFGQPLQIRADGAFEVRGLLPGRYSAVTIDSPKGQPAVTGLTSFVIADENVTDYAIPNNGGVTLRGSISLEGDLEGGGELQKLLPPYDPNAKPMLTIPEELMPRWAVLFEQDDKLLPYFDAYIQQDGTFAFDNALPFPARLGIFPPKGLYVKSATMGGQDLFHNEVNPVLGGEIRITYAKGAGSATIQMPSPCIVVLWSEEPMPGLSGYGLKSVNAASGLSTTFADLRPGKYHVAAFRGISMALATTRAFLNGIAPDAVEIEVPVGGSASGAAPLISAEKVKAAEQKVP